MTEVGLLIADMVRAGVAPDLIGRTAEALAHREAVLVPDEAALRRRAKDAERKRLRKSAEIVGTARNDVEAVSPKEVSPAPLQEITPSEPTTPKENPLRGQKKAVRLPADFAPDLVWAAEQGLTPSQAETEAAKFRDYWTAKGRDATKSDWPATWRNWVRSALERLPGNRDGPKRGPTILDIGKRLANEMEAANAGTSRQIEGNQPAPLRLSSG